MRSTLSKFCLIFITLSTLTLNASISNISVFDFVSPEEFGTSLVNRFWTKVQENDLPGYSNLIAHHFQGLNTSGVYTKEDQIAGLSGLTVTNFAIVNVVVAKYHKTLVVSYDFFAVGNDITSGPSIDVWHEKDGHWKLISHSYVPFLP